MEPNPAATPVRARLRAEVWIVIGLSVGQSAVYAVLSLADKLTQPISLGDQSTTLNGSQNARPWLDLLYQLASLGFSFVPVALALYLLREPTRSGTERIGLTWRLRPRDAGGGILLAAAIGIPGLGFYAIGRLLGITVDVVASDLGAHWWTIPVLLLSALWAGLFEEVIVVGYLFARLTELGWRSPVIIAASALLRGSYHLYQGFGPFIGNAVMGIVFAWVYRRWGRVTPLVVAHFLLDAVSFVGYAALSPWLAATFPAVFG